MELLFESRSNLSKFSGTLHFVQWQPEIHQEAVISPDTFVEGAGVSGYGTVLKESGTLRMWYQATPQDWPGIIDSAAVAYAESEDGFNWKKQPLGLVAHGPADNHLCDLGLHSPSVFVDPNSPPTHRYRATGYGKGAGASFLVRPGLRSGYYTAHSADGLQWEVDSPEPRWEDGDVITSIYHPGRKSGVTALKKRPWINRLRRRSIHTASYQQGEYSGHVSALYPDEYDDIAAAQRGHCTTDYYGMSMMPAGKSSVVGFLCNFRHDLPYSERPYATRGHSDMWYAMVFALALTPFITAEHPQAAPLTIVSKGKSTSTIVQPAVAAHSVVAAALELQRNIVTATGAQLPIRKDSENVTGPIISLGNTRQARAAGIDVAKIPDEGFRILNKDGDLYIAGLDTTTVDFYMLSGRNEREDLNVKLHPEIPGPAYIKNGGYSFGTANGVYTFLEDYLGVRWLMPGELGRDVPTRSTLTVADVNRTESPLFTHRVMPILQRTAAVAQWRDHMKLGYSYRINHGHNWNDIVPPEMFEKHPEWYAMAASGKRVDPGGNRAAKLETTNPELIKFVAARAIEALKKNPELQTFSLSPSDGLGYSQSPESKALYDPAPPGGGRASVTPLILKFYRDVAAIVEKEYPQGKLSGYLYSDYSQPPDVNMDLPDNLVPVLAGAAVGGFGLYRPEVREFEARLLTEWEKVAPEDWFYFAFATWLRVGSGMVTPAAPDGMNFLFSKLVDSRIKGFHYFGQPDWSQAAMTNYVAAKMLWNPQADARVLQREWLTRAYGAQAGAVMNEMYNKMDESWFSDYFRCPDSSRHNISENFFSRIYGAHYRDMEPFFLEAEKQPITPLQKQRFDMLRDNMRVLQWRLRQAGYLPAEYSSPLTINSQQVFDLLAIEDEDFRRFFNLVDRYGSSPAWVDIAIGAADKNAKAAVPNPYRILLYPTKDGEVRLKPSNVLSGSSFLIYYVQGGNGEGGVARGLLTNGEDITFNAKANTPYYLQIGTRGVTQNPQAKWDLLIPNVVPAQAAFQNKVLHLQSTPTGANAPLYVYVPETLSLNTSGSDAGVTIQPTTTEQQQHQTARAAMQATRAERTLALERYKGTLIQDLDNTWRFTTDADKIGEQQGFFKPDYDYRAWKPITAIGAWQDHGHDYHGTGWYRKHLLVTHDQIEPTWLGDNKVLLHFGAVDGDAVFYLNGTRIGEHKMSDYVNGWEVPVVFDVTDSLVMGRNVLAVQVTKNYKAAGLYRGVSLMAGVLPKK